MIKSFFRLLFISLFFSLPAIAQVPAWGGGSDDREVDFGFNFQYINTRYVVVKQPNWRAPYFDAEINQFVTDSLNSISSGGSPGFGIGFLTRLRIAENLDLRLTPSLVFSDRLIDYRYKTSSQDNQQRFQSTAVDFPLALKLKSDRIGNVRAYILGGVKYTAEIGSKKKLNDAGAAPLDKKIKNIRGFAAYEAGFGLDIYFEYFKLSPELKLSNSFGNILTPESHPYASPLDKLYLHNIQFSLYFE
ncbi:MAG: outer membrane beta-barrel protein [Sphingobacteriaceae bacterium]